MLKKISFTMLSLFIFNLLCPNLVMAEDDYEVLAQDNKYYKTIVKDNLFGTYSINTDYDIETIEITEAEFNAFNPATSVSPSLSTTIETTYKHMQTSILSNGSNYRYKNYLSWKNFPATRSYDVIGIGFEAIAALGSPMVFEQEYCNASGTCYNTYSHNPDVTGTGAGTVFALPTGSLSRLNQTLYIDVVKNTSSTITSQNIWGDYAHAQQSVALSSVYGFHVYSSAGIVLPSDVEDRFDTMNTTHVHWTGTW